MTDNVPLAMGPKVSNCRKFFDQNVRIFEVLILEEASSDCEKKMVDILLKPVERIELKLLL